MAQEAPTTSQGVESEKNCNSNTDFSFADVLRVYYGRLFPFKILTNWFGYGDADYFSRREFSFALEGDTYVRYNSYNDWKDFKKSIVQANPNKIDVGAVFSHPPSQHKSISPSAFVALQKELVFDIDMDDYNPVRSCCEGARVCGKCWNFLAIAIKVIDRALRDDFGFKHTLWIYSGRRGVHCWVSDKAARELSVEGRAAIVEYLSVIAENERSAVKTNLTHPLHPSLRRAYDEVLLPFFENVILEQQEVLERESSREKVLDMVRNCGDKFREIADAIQDHWASKPAPARRMWGEFRKTIEAGLKSTKNRSRNPLHDIVFYYTYPRLDENVSKGVNHLLKCPFCLHPGTGRVCVPIDVNECENFDPTTVPQGIELLKQIENYSENSKDIEDYKKTSLKPYYDFMVKQFLGPLLRGERERQSKSDELF